MQRMWVGMAALAMAMGCAQTGEAHGGRLHGGWQCVTYAASHSLIALRGNAHSWWDHAEGVYARSHQPALGSVLVIKSSASMPMGHVAIVSGIVGIREVLLTHANWKGDGSVETNVRAIDVSPAGDWSQVRVWYARVHAMGIRSFPAYGFILPVRASQMTPAPATVAAVSEPAPAPAQMAIADPHA